MRVTHSLAATLVALVLVGSACSSSGEKETDDGTTAAAGSLAGAGTAVDKDLACGEREVGLTRRLSTNATWSMCLQVDAKRGMVLRDVTLAAPGDAPLVIADEVALAQLEVPYDTGARLTEDITSAGFGGIKMQDLGTQECAGELVGVPVPTIGDGSQFGDVPTREVICSEVTDAGLAYRSAEGGEVVADRKDQWTLATVSKVGWYEYVTRYTFGADGSITPDLGATGDLSPVDFGSTGGSAVGKDDADHAASHAHNAVWRIDWALGGGALAAEQYDASPTGVQGAKAPVLAGKLKRLERATTAERSSRRWWRVVNPSRKNADGHPISYQVDLGASDAFTFVEDASRGARRGYDVAFTNADDCALFATGNDGVCGDGVPDYVAADTTPLTDVVSWVAVGFHHVPRDEDQSPMELHWQGFRLTPRDLTATRFDAPKERTDRNGQPETYEGEPVDELTDLPAE